MKNYDETMIVLQNFIDWFSPNKEVLQDLTGRLSDIKMMIHNKDIVIESMRGKLEQVTINQNEQLTINQ